MVSVFAAVEGSTRAAAEQDLPADADAARPQATKSYDTRNSCSEQAFTNQYRLDCVEGGKQSESPAPAEVCLQPRPVLISARRN